jgi:HSP20 family molecular chaperone IbpA
MNNLTRNGNDQAPAKAPANGSAAASAAASAAHAGATSEGALASRDLPAMTPPVDVIEDASGITLYADMPGVPRDKLSLKVEGDQLDIEGELTIPVPADIAVTYAEMNRTLYRRTFTLSKELDAEKIAAEFNNGVLTLRIPKAAHAQPRRIAIQAS